MPAPPPSPSLLSPSPTGVSSASSSSSSSSQGAQKSARGPAAAGSSALRSSSVSPPSPAAGLPRDACRLETAVSSTALAKGRPGPPSPRGARRSSSTVSTKSIPSKKLSARSLKKETKSASPDSEQKKSKEKVNAASRKSLASPQLAPETDTGVRGSRTDDAAQRPQSLESTVGTEALPSSSKSPSLIHGSSSSSAGASSSPVESLSSASASSFSPRLGRNEGASHGVEASSAAEENSGISEASASCQRRVLKGGDICVAEAREQKGEEDEEATRHRRVIDRVSEDFLAFSAGVSRQAERPSMRTLFPQASGRCDDADNEISLDSKAPEAPEFLASGALLSERSSWLRELVSPARKDLENSATHIAVGLSFSPSPPLSLSAASSAPPSSPPCAASRLASPAHSGRASTLPHSSSASPPPASSPCSSSCCSSSAGFEASFALRETPGGPQAGDRPVFLDAASQAKAASLPLSEKKEAREGQFARLTGTGDRASLVFSEEKPPRLSGVEAFGKTEQPEQKRDEREGESSEERADGRWAPRRGNAEQIASPEAEDKRETRSCAEHFFELTLEEKLHRRRVQDQVDGQQRFLLGDSRASRAAALAGAAAALDRADTERLQHVVEVQDRQILSLRDLILQKTGETESLESALRLAAEENAHLQNQVKEAQALCLEMKDRQNQLADSFYRDAHRWGQLLQDSSCND
ncbi:proteophosphoglycan PPG1 [Toxoplasma gondii TgCatPRC2]|uniref:Proteophosphoglycan PPG1 n=1 Tax=Toxoplasma gondii TgCatPRC2 TaxID=1130821 RepID=A0A151H213_TOXGO|nr:proteophosphoglycan PPG1 [Toxoplasma gondii TgCatPRC2]